MDDNEFVLGAYVLKMTGKMTETAPPVTVLVKNVRHGGLEEMCLINRYNWAATGTLLEFF